MLTKSTIYDEFILIQNATQQKTDNVKILNVF